MPAIDRLDITIEVRGVVGRFHVILRADPPCRPFFPKRFDGDTSHQEAMAEAIA